jgi:DNA-binding transcriptional LysR family regulator
MVQHDPGWELYRSFLAVLRAGSLSAAARALGLTQPTIGRHVEALEALLGARLFTRSQAGLLPTDIARAMLPQAEAMEAAAGALRRTASGPPDAVRGLVRITASDVIGAEILPPILTNLRINYPELDIALRLTNRLEDLLRRDADVAVRMAPPTQSALLARRLGTIDLGLFAHDSYLARHGMPSGAAALDGHAVIGFDEGSAYVRAMIAAGVSFGALPFALRTDSDLAAIAALRAGFGIGVCQVPLAARDKTLRPVLPDVALPSLPTWVVMHEDLAALRRAKLVFDALAEGLTTYIRSV